MSMNEKWNKGISLRKKRWISMIMAAVMIVTLVPFMPGKKAGKVEAAGYNIAAAVAYAKEWGGSKRILHTKSMMVIAQTLFRNV